MFYLNVLSKYSRVTTTCFRVSNSSLYQTVLEISKMKCQKPWKIVPVGDVLFDPRKECNYRYQRSISSPSFLLD